MYSLWLPTSTGSPESFWWTWGRERGLGTQPVVLWETLPHAEHPILPSLPFPAGLTKSKSGGKLYMDGLPPTPPCPAPTSALHPFTPA